MGKDRHKKEVQSTLVIISVISVSNQMLMIRSL
jgi:hypothetical protein